MTHARVERFAAILAIWHMADNAWQMADGKWHITHSIWHLPSGIRHLTSDIRHLTSGIRHPASDIRHLTSAICHLPFAICHLPSAICHLPSAICHLPSAILFSILVGLSQTTLQAGAWLAGPASRRTRSQPISSPIGWPPSTTFIGRPRGDVFLVSMLIPMDLVMVAIRSMTPTGRSVMSTPSLSVAPTVCPPLMPPPPIATDQLRGQ